VDKAAAVYRRILETSPETPEVAERLAELERKGKAAENNAKLIAMLERLCDNLKNRPTTGAAPASTSGDDLGPGKLAVGGPLVPGKGTS
jgi:hypothetical protein